METTPTRLNANAMEFSPAPPVAGVNANLGGGEGGGAEDDGGYKKKRKRDKRAGGPTPEQVSKA
jgi:hypothetical protein